MPFSELIIVSRKFWKSVSVSLSFGALAFPFHPDARMQVPDNRDLSAVACHGWVARPPPFVEENEKPPCMPLSCPSPNCEILRDNAFAMLRNPLE